MRRQNVAQHGVVGCAAVAAPPKLPSLRSGNFDNAGNVIGKSWARLVKKKEPASVRAKIKIIKGVY
jgi:hypothetical protein